MSCIRDHQPRLSRCWIWSFDFVWSREWTLYFICSLWNISSRHTFVTYLAYVGPVHFQGFTPVLQMQHRKQKMVPVFAVAYTSMIPKKQWERYSKKVLFLSYYCHIVNLLRLFQGSLINIWRVYPVLRSNAADILVFFITDLAELFYNPSNKSDGRIEVFGFRESDHGRML